MTDIKKLHEYFRYIGAILRNDSYYADKKHINMFVVGGNYLSEHITKHYSSYSNFESIYVIDDIRSGSKDAYASIILIFSEIPKRDQKPIAKLIRQGALVFDQTNLNNKFYVDATVDMKLSDTPFYIFTNVNLGYAAVSAIYHDFSFKKDLILDSLDVSIGTVVSRYLGDIREISVIEDKEITGYLYYDKNYTLKLDKEYNNFDIINPMYSPEFKLKINTIEQETGRIKDIKSYRKDIKDAKYDTIIYSILNTNKGIYKSCYKIDEEQRELIEVNIFHKCIKSIIRRLQLTEDDMETLVIPGNKIYSLERVLIDKNRLLNNIQNEFGGLLPSFGD